MVVQSSTADQALSTHEGRLNLIFSQRNHELLLLRKPFIRSATVNVQCPLGRHANRQASTSDPKFAYELSPHLIPSELDTSAAGKKSLR